MGNLNGNTYQRILKQIFNDNVSSNSNKWVNLDLSRIIFFITYCRKTSYISENRTSIGKRIKIQKNCIA